MKPPKTKGLSMKGRVLRVLSLYPDKSFSITCLQKTIAEKDSVRATRHTLKAALEEIDYAGGLIHEEIKRTGPFRQPVKFYSLIKKEN